MVHKKIILILCMIFLISSAVALPIYVKPLDGSGNVQPSTAFNYTFNFTTNADCTGVVLSNTSEITTGADGIGFIDIDVSGMSSIPGYLCEYVNGVSRANHTLSDQIFKDVYAKDVNISGNMSLGEKITFKLGEIIDNIVDGWIKITGNLQVDGDTNLTGSLNVSENVSASYYFGDGSQLTGISGLDNSSWNKTYADTLYASAGSGNASWNESYADTIFIPYTGANQNIVLGANNFSVNTNTLFVDSNNGRVGIGTTSPNSKLEIAKGSGVNELNVSGVLYVNSTSGNVGIGTTSPGAKLQINQVSNGLGQGFRIFATNELNYLEFYHDGSTGGVLRASDVGGGAMGWDFTMQGRNIHYETYYSGWYERLTILDNGNVGIGTTTPSSKLDVRGIGNFSGTIYINNATDISTFASTYNATYNTWAYNMTDGVGTGNASWNETYASDLYSGIEWDYNQTTATYTLYNNAWVSTYNATYAGSVNNDSYLSTYNATYANNEGNLSWNESYADTLYAPNTTSGIQDLINDTGVYSTYNATYDSNLDTNCSDGSCTVVLYRANESDLNVNKSDYWDSMGSINTTQMQDNAGVLNILVSWLEGLFISDTDESNLNVNSSNYWDNLDSPLDAWVSTYNATYASSVANNSWNETYADTLFIPYTGASENIVLGNNNFSVNSSTLFVDSNNGRVGIGTATPLWKLDISNSTQGIIMAPNGGISDSPIMNTTGSTNLSITSSGGSVIIRLG